MAGFPMIVTLQDRNVVLIGAGREALFKARTLLSFGAVVTLIADKIEPELAALVDQNPGYLFYIPKRFETTDLIPEDLLGPDREEERNQALESLAAVVAATDDPEVNARVSAFCRRYRIPVNVVDQTQLCTFIFPSIVKEKDVVCAVSSDGKSPLITQLIRDRIRDILPENIGEINDRMGEARPLVAGIRGREERKTAFHKILSMFLASSHPDDVTEEMIRAVIGARNGSEK